MKKGLHNLKFFDVEVFPDYWCVVVSDEEDHYPGQIYKNEFNKETELSIKSKMRVYTSDMDQLKTMEALKKDLKTGVIAGYNIKRYDLLMLKGIFAGFAPQKLYKASNIVINPDLANVDGESQRIAQYLRFGWSEAEAWYDMFDDDDKSLKDKECAHGMDIRETTVPFDKTNLIQEEKDDIVFYCKHDVYALHVHYWVTTRPYLDTKMALCEKYGIDKATGYKNTNAVLVGKVLEAVRQHGTTIKDPTITIYNKEADEYFRKWIPEDVYHHLLTSQDPKKFVLFENNVDTGDGGLHSVLKLNKIKGKSIGLYCESNDEYVLLNVDATSCHPSVMIFFDATSRAIKNKARFVDIFNSRLELKKKPKDQLTLDDKLALQAIKLVLNTTYGASGNKYLPLYDDYMRSKVCRVSQMILISLSNCIYENIPGVKVLQTNTDGVLLYIKRTDIPKLEELVSELSRISKFTFEFEEDSKIWQLNVNNYLAVRPNGSLKNKGGAFINSVHQEYGNRVRPLQNFCVTTAVMDYYAKGLDPIENIRNNTSVEDFCLCCTKGPTYDKIIQYNKGGYLELGKVSRVVAVTDENLGVIKKRKTIKKETKNQKIGDIKEDTVALCPPHPLVINNALYNYKIKDGQLIGIECKLDLDYEYYFKELEKALDVVWYKLDEKGLNITNEFDFRRN